MSLTGWVVVAFGAVTGGYLLWLVGARHGVLGLLILSSPIHRLSVDIGFSLKLFYIVIFATIARNIWRADGDPFVVRTTVFLRLVSWFIAAIVVSALVTGATITSVRHIIVLVFVLLGCYLVQSEIQSRADIKRLVDVYLVTGLFLGVSGLLYYIGYFVVPQIYTPGSFFDAVTYDPTRPWTVPLLQSVDVGTNGYAMSLLPFLFVSMSEVVRADTHRRKTYALAVFLLLASNLLLTFSRGGVIAFVMASLGWIYTRRGGRGMKTLATVLLLATLPLIPKVINLYRDYSYLKGSYSGNDEALLSGRGQLAMKALTIIAQHPVFGIGDGNITRPEYVGKEAHNTYLEVLAEDGSIAFALCAAIVLVITRQLWRARRALDTADSYAIVMSIVFGFIALLIALIPTSALTMPLLWIQATVLYSVATIELIESRTTMVGRQILPSN